MTIIIVSIGILGFLMAKDEQVETSLVVETPCIVAARIHLDVILYLKDEDHLSIHA